MTTTSRNLAVLLIATLFVVAQTAPAGAVVLLDDHFDNGDLATGGANGGFKKVSNGVPNAGAGTVTEPAGTDARIAANGGNNNNTGIVSINSFDPTAIAQGGFTARWVVTSADNPKANGINLTLQSDDGFINNAAGRPNLLFRFDQNDDGRFRLKAHDGSTNVDLVNLNITLGQALDGFTLTAYLNEAGWSYETEGLPSLAANSGSWTGTHSYNTLFDSSTFVGGFIQRGGNNPGNRVMFVDRITISIVPEPSTLALAALSLLSLGCIGWRRRRR